ncbi:MAG: ribonuclease P protein component [Flavobacteriales bacterium]|nr:ribonuclease P protein component [Flavobacteriales bacterium]|tara:strand:+ start:489 stop:860 length:372 start_codon:yes stop_codon:yes gene_type:complete
MQKLKKTEILNHKKKIDQLFKSGNRFLIDEFQVVYSTSNSYDNWFNILVSVPKKKIKLACTRNLLKRRIKEVIRRKKGKYILKLKDKKKHVKIAFIYNSEKVLTYKVIEEKINLILQRLLKET